MKNEAGVSRLGILFGITLAALVVSILWHLKPRNPWHHPIHVVFQGVHPDPSNDDPHHPNNPGGINDQKKKLSDALAKLLHDQDNKTRMHNVYWDGVLIPDLTMDEKQGDFSCDAGDTKSTAHVTQQASFLTAAQLQKFLTDSGIK